ncbi:MAG: ABC transporter ATP-binding protein [Spirochaetales bacterium]|nr:ABC transporter ATP-binding protein [Spirochaetales bacterium]
MITLENLGFQYSKKAPAPLFKDLNLKLERGNIYGLLGLNGAGKTSLLKIMSGQLFRTAGEADVIGFDPGSRKPEMLREIFYVPEEFYLPRMKAETYLKLNTVYYPRFDREKFEEYCTTFQLDTSLNISDFSFGQKKKFLLAFGLASQATLLILDEPTNGLDIPSKTQFRKTVASALTKERSFIISTHQVRDMENLFDPLVILHEGKIVLNRTMGELSSRISMENSFTEPVLSENILYTEKVPGGWCTLRADSSPENETTLDLEVLFNAVIYFPQEINALFEEVKS